MAQWCWKTLKMVKIYMRAEAAGRAAKWLAKGKPKIEEKLKVAYAGSISVRA